MVQRVVYGNLPGGGAGLRVSRPGFNVLDAGLASQFLAFDSRWANNYRLHSVATVSLSGTTTPRSYSSFAFGVTFPSVPSVFAFNVNGNQYSPVSDGANGFPIEWPDYEPTLQASMRLFTDRVEFLRPYSGTRTVRYFVLRPI